MADLKTTIQQVDPEVLVTWIAYLRFVETNPGDRDAQTACRRYENGHLEVLRPLILELSSHLNHRRPFIKES